MPITGPDTPDHVGSSEVLSVRLARPADTGAMREVAKAAYQLYVDRIGREPAPMTADYGEIAKPGQPLGSSLCR